MTSMYKEVKMSSEGKNTKNVGWMSAPFDSI